MPARAALLERTNASIHSAPGLIIFPHFHISSWEKVSSSVIDFYVVLQGHCIEIIACKCLTRGATTATFKL